MALSKMLSTNNTIFCIRNSYRSQQYLKSISNNYFSLNTKRLYSLYTSKTVSFNKYLSNVIIVQYFVQ